MTQRERFKSEKLRPGRPPKVDTRQQYQSLGAPPIDPLQATEWAHEALAVSFYHAMNDREHSEQSRRREMREIARAMQALMPQTRLIAAERVVRGEDDRLDSGLDDVEVEDVAPMATAAPAKVRRGRPRKR